MQPLPPWRHLCQSIWRGPLVERKTGPGVNAGSGAALFPGYAVVSPSMSLAKILRTSEMVHASLEVCLYPLSTGKSKSRDRRLVDARVFEKHEQL